MDIDIQTTQEQLPQTVTSMKENIASFPSATQNDTDSRKILGKIVDFPGHPSVRKCAFMCYFI